MVASIVGDSDVVDDDGDAGEGIDVVLAEEEQDASSMELNVRLIKIICLILNFLS
jgi:hypothetical protein